MLTIFAIKVLSFLVAIGILVAVHEWGHYRVAVACGVKVLRFSVGFGRTLYAWKPKRQRPGQDTEFVLGLFPLGGYVRMLDEREGPVDAAERHRAFNTQPLRVRAAVVAAGPAANLLLAVLFYAAVDWWGVQEPRPVLAPPVAGSVAQKSGLVGGENVLRAAFDDEPLAPVQSFDDVRWLLTRAALDGHDVRLEAMQDGRRGTREFVLPLAQLRPREADATLFRQIGILGALTRPVLGDVVPGGPADRAGLRKGDVVQRIGETAIVDSSQLYDWIQSQVAGQASAWRVEREGRSIDLQVRPDTITEDGRRFGRIGVALSGRPEMVEVRHGPIDGLRRAVVKTWDMSVLTVRMMGRMVVGQAWLKNLSGPLTIADVAGKSASLGVVQFLVFLAIVSVSLGVLNLLPLPVLDGGHLMYYLWEAVTGRSVSDAWMERLQRGGVAVLLEMMSIALFNDVTPFLVALQTALPQPSPGTRGPSWIR